MRQTKSSRSFFMVTLSTPAAATAVTPVASVWTHWRPALSEPEDLQESVSKLPASRLHAGRFAQGSVPKLPTERKQKELGGQIHERHPGFGAFGGTRTGALIFRVPRCGRPLWLVRGRITRTVRFGRRLVRRQLVGRRR